MSKSCEKFKTPVTGGNVSFYNQSTIKGSTIPVFPTPTIGMLGVLEDKNNKMGLSFKNEGDLIYLLGESKNDINSSEYLYSYHGVKLSPPPSFNLDEEFLLQENLQKLIKDKQVLSAHDCADGGLFIALLESGYYHQKGFKINTNKNLRKDAFLFGEAQTRVVVSVKADDKVAFENALKNMNQHFEYLGEVTSSEISIDNDNWGTIKDFYKIYYNVLAEYIDGGKTVEKI
jgi:phosphoribosylformylglycinamidine synthase